MNTLEKLFNKYFEKTENINNIKNGIILKNVWTTIINDDEYNNLKYKERSLLGGKNNFYKWLETNGIIIGGNSKTSKIALNLILKNNINQFNQFV